MSTQTEGKRSEIWRSLQALTREEGVWRPNLVELLKGELRCLQSIWQLDLDREPDLIRRSVEVNLFDLIIRLSPRVARQTLPVKSRLRQYQQVVAVSFNLAIAKYPELRTMNLGQRRNWLSGKECGPLRIAVSTGQDDLIHAIDQMEQLLTRGDYKSADLPNSVDVAGSVTEADIEQPAAIFSTEQAQSSGNSHGEHVGTGEATKPGASSASEPSPPESAQYYSSAQPASIIERLSKRLALERSALAALFSRAGRAIKRRVRWLTLAVVVGIVFAGLSGQLLARAQDDPVWFGPLRVVTDFAIQQQAVVQIAFVASLLTGAVVAVFAKRRRWTAYIAAAHLVLHDGALGASLIVANRERSAYNTLASEVNSWSLEHALRFDGKNPAAGDPYQDVCKEFQTNPTQPDITNEVVRQRLADLDGTELVRKTACSIEAGALTLRTSGYYNGLPGDRAQDYDGQVYAEALVRPGDGTFWSECGIGAVPSYQSKTSNFLAFGLELVESAEGPQYRPTISLVGSAIETVVARSDITIPFSGDGSFGSAPRAGWAKFGVHRTGKTYDFFVNDHEVLSYDWAGGAEKMHFSLQARGDTRFDRALSCHLDNFLYWTKPMQAKAN
jgi:hypothetical protein